MKIFLLSLTYLLLAFSSQGQVVNIPDANFKNALLNHNPIINTNGDGEIQVSEAVAFAGTMNIGFRNITDLTGINAFTNLKELLCGYNQLTSMNISGLNALTYMNCSQNLLTSLDINNLPVLKTLYCGGNSLTTLSLSNLPQLQELMSSQNKFTSLSLSGLPAMKTINLQDCSLMTTLSISNMPNLTSLNCNACKLTTLNMNGLTTLQTLFCSSNQLTSLTLSHPAVLQDLSADNNQFTALPAGLSALQNISITDNKISVFNLANLNSLHSLRMFNNSCTSLTLSNKPSLLSVDCRNNLISNLSLNTLPSLRDLYCDHNQLSTLTLNSFSSLEVVRCNNNKLTSLTLTNSPLMKDFFCSNNQLTSLSLSNMPFLKWIQCQNNQLTNITLGNLPSLYEIFCDNNQLISLPFFNATTLPVLRSISFAGNKIPRLIVKDHPILGQIIAGSNPIDSVSLKNIPLLSWLSIERTPLTLLILDTLPKLRTLYCGWSDSLKNISLKLPALEQFYCDSSKLVTADFSQTKVYQCVVRHNPLLQYINLRNNMVGNPFYPYTFHDNPSLNFICVDDNEETRIVDTVHNQLPGQGVIVSTICNYTPATSSTIKGTIRFDLGGNGCSNADSTMMNVKLDNNDGVYSTAAFTTSSGQYIFHTPANTDTVAVTLQQPLWFNASPPKHIINIPNSGITAIADFCITAVGVHPDLEISMLPIINARPGFDAQYKLVYRNKGNQLQSGSINLIFDAVKLNFLSAVPFISGQTPGNLSWTFSSLSPYETRAIILIMHVNAPPVVNIGDVLSFTAVIDPITGDETPTDNTFNFNQRVRGAFDPNDKDVTEGESIDISKASDYLHYIVRFQNTGDLPAVKIVVKDSLADNLDWSTLIPIAASHPYKASISKGNKVEFVFDNINLPGINTDEPGSHGFIAFKIKPKQSIAIGETIKNNAAIYFDFNLPVITNTVLTKIIKKVNNVNNVSGVSAYPNPVKDFLWLTVENGVSIRSVALFNNIGQRVYAENNLNTIIDKKIAVKNLSQGLFFLEVVTSKGKLAQKIMIIN